MDKLSLGLFVTVSGMGIVFLSLSFLWVVMESFSIKKKNKPITINDNSDDTVSEHLLVIIAAACTVALDTEFEIKKITLIKERRVTNSLWAFIGRLGDYNNSFKGDRK
jgi:Na+-transporting methylmalonyl-CoA/oxaloacetate decarboxylase gamma subunit